MKKVLTTITILMFLVSVFANANGKSKNIGVTYTQVTKYLLKDLTIKKSITASGQSLYIGLTEDHTSLLIIEGSKHNISKATLLVGIAKDVTITSRNIAMLTRFVANISPGWSDHDCVSWTLDAMKEAHASPEKSVSIVRGNKKIELDYKASIPGYMVIVRPK